MIDSILQYEPISNLLKLNSGPINHEEFKKSFLDYVKSINTSDYKKACFYDNNKEHMLLSIDYSNNDKMIPNKKVDILDNCKSINCFICLDTQKLWKNRNYFSTFDKQGKYEIVKCYNCSDGLHVKYIPTNFILDNDIKIFQYPYPSFTDIINELEKTDESIPLWNGCKYRKVTRIISEKRLNIDIEKLTLDISNLIQIHLGNVLSLSNFITSLDTNLSSFYYDEDNNNKWFEEIDDKDHKIFIFFILEKKFTKVNYDCGLLRLSGMMTEKIFNIRYMISNPKNKCAEKKLNQFMNMNIQEIMSNMMN